MQRKVYRLFLVLAVAFMLLVVLLLHYRNVGLLNVSSVHAAFGDIGVYWDENCTMPVSSISWGNLSLGQEKNVTVYVKNYGNETDFLTEVALDWSPVEASQYLNFSWDITKREIPAGSTINVTQTLQVPMNTMGISTFSFSINFYGSKIGDIGGGSPPQYFAFDGNVGSDDLALFLQCYRGQAPKYVYELCDIGGGAPPQLYKSDGKVDGSDLDLELVLIKEQYNST
jgi:hypothetical protein